MSHLRAAAKGAAAKSAVAKGAVAEGTAARRTAARHAPAVSESLRGLGHRRLTATAHA